MRYSIIFTILFVASINVSTTQAANVKVVDEYVNEQDPSMIVPLQQNQRRMKTKTPKAVKASKAPKAEVSSGAPKAPKAAKKTKTPKRRNVRARDLEE